MSLTTDSRAAAVASRIRAHVLSAPDDPVLASQHLILLLDEGDLVLREIRVTLLHQRYRAWAGGEHAAVVDQSATDPLEDVRRALLASVDLLKYWSKQRGDVIGALGPEANHRWGQWLRADGRRYAAIAEPEALDGLSNLRQYALSLQESLTTTTDELRNALHQIKALTLRAVGRHLPTLVDNLSAVEGLALPEWTLMSPAVRSPRALEIARSASESQLASHVPWRRHTTPEKISKLEVDVVGWSKFAEDLTRWVSFDLEPRIGKRQISACLPFADGHSTVLVSLDDTVEASLSMLHEIAHSFFYWTLRQVPEVARPPRAHDEQIALAVELRITRAWIATLPPVPQNQAIRAARRRWSLMIHGSLARLTTEIQLLRALALTPHSEGLVCQALSRFDDPTLRGNPQLFQEELASGRYLVGGLAALTSISRGPDPIDVRLCMQNLLTSSGNGAEGANYSSTESMIEYLISAPKDN